MWNIDDQYRNQNININSNIKNQASRTNTDAQNEEAQATDARALELILAEADLLLCGTDLCSISARNLLVTSFSTPQLKDAFGPSKGIQHDIVIDHDPLLCIPKLLKQAEVNLKNPLGQFHRQWRYTQLHRCRHQVDIDWDIDWDIRKIKKVH